MTMSFRLPAEEADAIREAAAAAGTSLSEWIRWATMRAARDTDVPPPRHAAISVPGSCCRRRRTSWGACSPDNVKSGGGCDAGAAWFEASACPGRHRNRRTPPRVARNVPRSGVPARSHTSASAAAQV